MFDSTKSTGAGLIRRFGRAQLLRHFLRRQDGAAAIEFGIVALPFFALLLAIIETAFMMYADQVLETAASDSARLIMTGQAQTQGYDATAFKNQVCARISGVFDCKNSVYVDVRTYTSFSSANPNSGMGGLLDGQGNLQTNFQYQTGGPGDIVVARLIYKWPLYSTLLSMNTLSNMAGSNRLLVASAAFRNEPY
jgi:Flp pilus assembly protein TadG